jgi:glutamyl-tRNA synthetase
MAEVRTRIAPSPTGDPHVGTAYTALFNYCFAKARGGTFILRIEDTDQKRSTAASEQAILDALRWCGIPWDEGPDVGGPHGPYRQSERAALYQQHAQMLLDSGHAFRCFCTADRLATLRREQMASGASKLGYDGHCIGVSSDDSAARAAAGEPHVVRLKVPQEGTCVVRDELRGAIEIPWAQVDMQVLMKSDGLPTYHLANVVDDHHMRITHVMRGEEWINSAPKHLLLYEAFGWEPPSLCHLPLLRNPDKSKLSKRKNPTGILWFKEMGFLPGALVNYLGLMAYSMPDEREIFAMDEMAATFSQERISLGGPVFDLDKLTWVNRSWLRDRTTDDEFVEHVIDWKLNRAFLKQVAALARTRLGTLGDLPLMAGYLATGRLPIEASQFDGMGEPAELVRALVLVEEQLNAVPAWEAAAIEAVLRRTADHLELKLRKFLPPFYLAMSGQKVSLPLFDAMALLGRDVTRDRLRQATEALGGASKKARKRLDKELRTLKAG